MANKQTQVLIWESVVKSNESGGMTVTALRPVSSISVAQAAQVLGMSRWHVGHLCRAGLISGYKPGAVVVRKDGRRNNATWRLDSGSVLDYRQQQIEVARREFS
jgi:hypothetical protein